MQPITVMVLLENHHPQDMKLMLFALRANRVPFSLFNNIESCNTYLDQKKKEGGSPHLLLTDTENIEFLQQFSIKYPFCMNAVMIGRDLRVLFTDEEMFNAINCFIARNDPNNVYFPHQIMGAVKRILDRDFFGLRHFMHGSYTSTTKIINSTEECKSMITEISDYVEGISQSKSVATQVEGVCDELLMNALYDANPKYENSNRMEDINLEEREKIMINYGCDGRMFAISVTDQFGRLGKDTIFEYLRRCLFEEKRVNFNGSGAGLGFYRILNSVNSLVINVIPDRKTEVIGILDISLNRRAFQQIKKSFYYLKI